jgi:hypothetical protein
LVHSRDVFGMGKDLLELLLVEVGYTNRAGEPGLLDALHGCPCLANVWLRDAGLMNEIQVYIREAQLARRQRLTYSGARMEHTFFREL